jgi:hypothetical protein
MGNVTLKRIMEALKQKVVIDENQTKWEDKDLKLVYVSNSASPEQSTDQATSQGTEVLEAV